ncbi:hypothetical protein [Jatrophihabitans sp.]|uniref:hypothetical protein n=1 Tax=Jatrophihabitans sp. TaxID=1932789 RepID=UPI0038CDAFF0
MVRPVSVTLGPPVPIPICTDWRPASSMGFWALAEPLAVGDSVADADPLAEGEPLAEGDPVADADPLAEADPLADADPLAEGEALAVELSVAELEGCPDPDAAGEELEPALNRAPLAAVEVTDTSLSAAVPRLMITIRSGASEPLG